MVSSPSAFAGAHLEPEHQHISPYVVISPNVVKRALRYPTPSVSHQQPRFNPAAPVLACVAQKGAAVLILPGC